MNTKITASCLSLALVLGLFSTTALAAEYPNQPADADEAVAQSQEVAEPTPRQKKAGEKKSILCGRGEYPGLHRRY